MQNNKTEPLGVVRFKDVTKSYDGRSLVIRDLNLTISQGEFLTLLGPSGSGKTTALMMLAGFESATSGSILINGVNVNDVPPFKRNMGVVFQNYALFPHMTVAENLAFPLRARGMARSERDERIRKTLDMVKMGGKESRLPGQLSGGQQQRIALARALVFDPPVVLMDEPLSALDKQLREHMQFEIKALHKLLGVTVVYVTHDQGEALAMSDRVAVFNNGVIQQLGSPSSLYETPNSLFVAQFIGENNMREGVIIGKEGEVVTIRLRSGEEITAISRWAGTVGARTVVTIRPERVILGDHGDTTKRNRYEVEVREVVYMGDVIRVRACFAGRDDFVAKIRNVAVHERPQTGTTVVMSWGTEDAISLGVG